MNPFASETPSNSVSTTSAASSSSSSSGGGGSLDDFSSFATTTMANALLSPPSATITMHNGIGGRNENPISLLQQMTSNVDAHQPIKTDSSTDPSQQQHQHFGGGPSSVAAANFFAANGNGGPYAAAAAANYYNAYAAAFVNSSIATPSLQYVYQRGSALGCTNGGTVKKGRMTYHRHQTSTLEARFLQTAYVTKKQREELTQLTSLSDRQIKIWFQNRRMKRKKEEGKGVATSQSQSEGNSSGSAHHNRIKADPSDLQQQMPPPPNGLSSVDEHSPLMHSGGDLPSMGDANGRLLAVAPPFQEQQQHSDCALSGASSLMGAYATDSSRYGTHTGWMGSHPGYPFPGAVEGAMNFPTNMMPAFQSAQAVAAATTYHPYYPQGNIPISANYMMSHFNSGRET